MGQGGVKTPLNWYEEYIKTNLEFTYGTIGTTTSGVNATMKITRIGNQVTLTVRSTTQTMSVPLSTSTYLYINSVIPSQFLPSNISITGVFQYDQTGIGGGIIGRTFIIGSSLIQLGVANSSFFPIGNLTIYPFSMTWCI